MHRQRLARVVIAALGVALVIMAYLLVSSLGQFLPPRYPHAWMLMDSENPVLWKKVKPNHEQVYDGLMIRIPATVIRTNSQGFRDDEWELRKPERTYRIAVLGDSMAFGLGVEQDEPFPAILEGLLNGQQGDLTYEVLNFAVPGYNTAAEVELFRETGRMYGPDLVILQFMDNDDQNRTRVREIFSAMAGDNTSTEGSPRDIERAVYEQLWAEEAGMAFGERWAMVGGPLRELRSLLNGTPLIIVSFSFDGQQTEALGALGEEFGWPVLHVRSIYGAGPGDREYRRFIVHQMDIHPSPEGHRRVAEALFREITGKDITGGQGGLSLSPTSLTT